MEAKKVGTFQVIEFEQKFPTDQFEDETGEQKKIKSEKKRAARFKSREGQEYQQIPSIAIEESNTDEKIATSFSALNLNSDQKEVEKPKRRGFLDFFKKKEKARVNKTQSSEDQSTVGETHDRVSEISKGKIGEGTLVNSTSLEKLSSLTFQQQKMIKKESLIRKGSAPVSGTNWKPQQIIVTTKDLSKIMENIEPRLWRDSSIGMTSSDISAIIHTFENIFHLFGFQPTLISEEGLLEFLMSFKREDSFFAVLKAVKAEIKKMKLSQRKELAQIVLRMVKKGEQQGKNHTDLPKNDSRVQFLLFLKGVELELLCSSVSDLESYGPISDLLNQAKKEGDLLSILDIVREEIKQLLPVQRERLIKITYQALVSKGDQEEGVSSDKQDPRTHFLAFLRGVELALFCASDNVEREILLAKLISIKKETDLLSWTLEMIESELRELSQPQRERLANLVCKIVEDQVKEKLYTRSDNPELKFLFFLRKIELEHMFGKWLFIKPALIAIPNDSHGSARLAEIYDAKEVAQSLGHPIVTTSMNMYFKQLYEHMKNYFTSNPCFKEIQETLLELHMSDCEGNKDEAEKRFVADFFFRNIVPEISDVGVRLQRASNEDLVTLGKEFAVLTRIIQRIIAELQHPSQTNMPISWVQYYTKIKRFILGETAAQISPAPSIDQMFQQRDINSNT